MSEWTNDQIADEEDKALNAGIEEHMLEVRRLLNEETFPYELNPDWERVTNVKVVDAARRLVDANDLVQVQAEDEGLWFIAETAPEAYLQQELRRLHAVIEGGQ